MGRGLPSYDELRRVASFDAETALNSGDHRLALFYLCRAAGPPFEDLWRYVADDIVSVDPPGAISRKKSLHPDNRTLP